EFLRRRHRLYGRAGLLDYALAEEEGLEVALSRLKQANIPHHRVGHGLFPKRVVCNPPLPLLQGFLSPNPAPEQTQQPNGVTGLHALVVGSPAYPAALAQHRRLLGPPLAFEAYEGRRRAVFAIGKHFLYLQGAEQEGLQGLILRSRYALWGALEPTQTQGVALSLVGDPVFELTGDSAPETEG
ncbi:MAG: glyoxalase/bleomycin resistance/dioxygenase family protein, partial [Meiothermus sp.]|nr:glyoxalase/bleomycin resistance/dioxygenase family protein [Meiothermus sp.]